MNNILIDTKPDYTPTLRNSISSLFQIIRFEVFSIIEFLGYSKKDYVLQTYPFSLSRVDGGPVPETLLGCIKARLSGRADLVS
jgi:hypothetical protein